MSVSISQQVCGYIAKSINSLIRMMELVKLSEIDILSKCQYSCIWMDRWIEYRKVTYTGTISTRLRLPTLSVFNKINFNYKIEFYIDYIPKIKIPFIFMIKNSLWMKKVTLIFLWLFLNYEKTIQTIFVCVKYLFLYSILFFSKKNYLLGSITTKISRIWTSRLILKGV